MKSKTSVSMASRKTDDKHGSAPSTVERQGQAGSIGRGMLYVIATPIGNMGDLSNRAVETLRSVDVLLCEDTRNFQKIAAHYAISTPRQSYHEHNERRITPTLVEQLLAGKSFALVTDSGTPLVSDPGFRLVQAARNLGIKVSPIPGACSPIVALSVSGLPTDKFTFYGFLPVKSGRRLRALNEALQSPHTGIILESPHRIVRLLEELAQLAPDRPVFLAREMTKLYEEFVSGSAIDVSNQFKARQTVKGEFVLIISGKGSDNQAPEVNSVADEAESEN